MKQTEKRFCMADYPYNLLRAVNESGRLTMPEKLTEDVEAGISYAVSTLSEGERRLLYLRYQEQKTLEEAAESMEIAVEDAADMEKYALRTLQLPGRWNYIRYGVANYLRCRIAKEHAIAYKEGYWTGYRKGVEDSKDGAPVALEDKDVLDLPLIALQLSTYAYNRLYFANCNSVRDVVKLGENEPMRIRNLGEKTAVEIAQGLRELGIKNSRWNEFLPLSIENS